MTDAAAQLALVADPGARPFFSARAYSSLLKGWRTPPELFLALCRYAACLPPDAPADQVPRPWVDPCATVASALVPHFFGPAEDGLAQAWKPPESGPDFLIVNPPYGNPEEACPTRCRKKTCEKRGHHLAERVPGIEDWMQKAREESLCWRMRTLNVIPYRAGAGWFADTLRPAAASSGMWLGGQALPGHLAPFGAYWPCTSWTLYRWQRLEVEVSVLKGRQHFLTEDTGEDTGPAGFDSVILTFRGLGR